MPCWTILFIGSLDATWTIVAFAKSPAMKPGDLTGHRFTRPDGQELCLWMILRPPEGGLTRARSHSASNLSLTWIFDLAWIPDSPAKKPGKVSRKLAVILYNTFKGEAYESIEKPSSIIEANIAHIQSLIQDDQHRGMA